MKQIRYYISDPTAPKGFVELTESEWVALMGDETTQPYAAQVYCGKITIEDVPEELREAVLAVVDNKVARWGMYSEREISPNEALTILTGGAEDEA